VSGKSPELTVKADKGKVNNESWRSPQAKRPQNMITQESTALLDELMDPLGHCLTPDVARRIVRLRASPRLDARIQELGCKCNEGQLTPEERKDYETIARFIKFVSLLQSKARMVLAQADGD